MTERRFPMQRSHLLVGQRGYATEQPAGSIPWRVAERIYSYYECLYGGSQTLERLAERAGFAWNEVAFIIREHEGRRIMGCPFVKH